MIYRKTLQHADNGPQLNRLGIPILSLPRYAATCRNIPHHHFNVPAGNSRSGVGRQA